MCYSLFSCFLAKNDEQEFYEPTEEFKEQIPKIVCPICGKQTRGIIQQKYRTYNCYSITCKKEEISTPRTFCGWCGTNFSGMSEHPCVNCGIIMLYRSQHCINCGLYKFTKNTKVIDPETVDVLDVKVDLDQIPEEFRGSE